MRQVLKEVLDQRKHYDDGSRGLPGPSRGVGVVRTQLGTGTIGPTMLMRMFLVQ